MRGSLRPRRHHRRSIWIAVLLALALVTPFIPQHIAQAQLATVEVQNLNNDGTNSLRWAIDQVASGGEITFAAGLSGTIPLTSQLGINKDLTITGPGSDVITISGEDVTRAVQVYSGAEVAITGLTISGGYAFSGGGIYNSGTLSLTNSTVSGNHSDNTGAGIYNTGTLTLTNSTVTGNRTTNTGAGGMYSLGTLTIVNSALTGNIARTAGGGVQATGTLTVINSTVSGNTAGASGGGIHVSGATTVVINSTIAGNTSATTGGGMYVSGGTTIVTNSTIAGNTSAGFGSAFNRDVGTTSVFVTGSIVASAPTTSLACNVPVGGTYNLSSDTSCFADDGTNLPDTDPLLGILADNDGPTETMLPASSSPVVNAIPLEACPLDEEGQPLPDQRGVARPQFGACDIGAVESLTPPPPTLELPGEFTVPATSAAGAAVVFEVTALDWAGVPLAEECEPASGTTFTVGTHTVTCWAEDAWEQVVEGSFAVTVINADEQLAALIADVEAGAIPAFLKPRLLVVLSNANLALDRAATPVVCHTLQTFANQVAGLSPRYVGAALADDWQAQVQTIRGALSCP